MYQEVKARSKKTLSGLKGKFAILIVLFYFAPKIFMKIVENGFLILIALIFGLFCQYGLYKLFLVAAKEGDFKFDDLILKAKNYFNLIIGGIIISLIYFVAFIPVIAIIISTGALAVLNGQGFGVAAFISIAFSVAICLYIFLLYYLFPYYAVDSEDGGAIDLLKEARTTMSGHKLEAFIMELSFIPWYILVVLTVGIAGIYVAPYILLSRANFYLELTGKAEKESLSEIL